MASKSIRPQKEVAESSFEFIFGELVRYALNTQLSSEFNEQTKKNEEFINANIIHEENSKLEQLGYDVGYRFVERCTYDRTRLLDSLDVIKFLCREFWTQIFLKQIDKLQTNHRGVYVLQDSDFRWLRSLSTSNSDETKRKAKLFLLFPCGIIRGALSNLGVEVTVTPDVLSLPSCIFNIQIK